MGTGARHRGRETHTHPARRAFSAITGFEIATRRSAQLALEPRTARSQTPSHRFSASVSYRLVLLGDERSFELDDDLLTLRKERWSETSGDDPRRWETVSIQHGPTPEAIADMLDAIGLDRDLIEEIKRATNELRTLMPEGRGELQE